MGQYITTWLIYRPISEMKISDISPHDTFEEFLTNKFDELLQKISIPCESSTLNMLYVVSYDLCRQSHVYSSSGI